MKTIIVFSHLRWGTVFDRPQQIMTRLARNYKIIYVEEPVQTGDVYIASTQVAPNVMALVPHTVGNGLGFNDAQMAVIGPMLKAWLIYHADVEDGYGFWFYTPQALPMKDAFGPEFIVFDIMDEFVPSPSLVKDRETELIRIADVVIAEGPSLTRANLEARPDILSLPSGVDADHYSPTRVSEAEAAARKVDSLQHHIPHPRLGYFGTINERIDLDLLTEITSTDPRWHVVMVGPFEGIDPADVPQHQNLHWLGALPYSLLPKMAHGWDACLIPFKENDSTLLGSPTKTLEYLAAEKPVISTAVPDVVELYGNVVRVGASQDEFIAGIRASLAETDQEKADRIFAGNAIVNAHSWDDVVETIHQAIVTATN